MSCSEPASAPSRRRALGALLALGALSACGFAPVYGPGGTGAALFGRVSVEAPATEAGYTLRRRLIERLGTAQAPEWHLSVDLDISSAAGAVTTEQVTTRYNLPGAARYTLTERAGGRIVAQGSVQSFTSYSATGTAVATFAAEADARDRLAVILADQILTRLATVAP